MNENETNDVDEQPAENARAGDVEKEEPQKRFYTRCEADEAVTAFLDYCNQE